MKHFLWSSRFILLLSILALPLYSVGGRDNETKESTVIEPINDSYPVVIEHKYGFTKIEKPPMRIVSIGYTDQDALLALGLVPLAIRDWYGDQPFATWPWAVDLLGDAKPVVLSASELNIEHIASLNPDIIIGISSGITVEEYTLLSKIAPTVTQSGEYADYGTPWKVSLKVMAKIFDIGEKADAIIREVDSKITQIKIEFPQFSGSTAAVAFIYQNLPGSYSSHDPRSQLLEEIGFEIPPEYDEIAGDSFYLSFSEERIDLLNTDVVLWLSSSEKDRKELRSHSLRKKLERYEENRELILDQILGGAFSFASPLSIPYLLDKLVPGLAAAVDGNPETLIPDDLR